MKPSQFYSLASINTLPQEILVFIFDIASHRKQTRKNLTLKTQTSISPTVFVLSGVCTDWRQILLARNSLWSRLDIVVSGATSDSDYLRAKLWAERSRGAPLHIEVWDYKSHFAANGNALALAEVSRLSSFLVPLMPRVCELEIVIQIPSRCLVDSILACWIKHGSLGSAQTLKVWHRTSSHEALQLQAPEDLPRDVQVTRDDFEVFFRSLFSLTLQNSFVPWGSAAYHGLVELRLERLHEATQVVTQSQLAGVLAASPRLRSLMLIETRVARDDLESRFSPIRLGSLSVLSLESSEFSRDFRLVYPLLAVESDSLSMSITLDDDVDFIAEARSFLCRSNITTLHVDGHDESIALTQLLGPMPHLHTLVLKSLDINDYTIPYSSRGDFAVLWPQLHTLYLFECVTVPSCLGRIVASHSIQSLWVLCDAIESSSRDWRELEELWSKSTTVVQLSDRWVQNPTEDWNFVNNVGRRRSFARLSCSWPLGDIPDEDWSES